jgi:TP901 family phage tail tape measure protein
MVESSSKELKLVLTATDRDLQKVLNRVNKELKRLGEDTDKSAKKAGAALDRFSNKAKVSTKGAGKAISGFSKRSTRALKVLTRAVFNVRNGILSLGAGVVVKSITTFASKFELSLANINTLLVDGDVSIGRYRKQLLALSKVSSKEVIDLSKALYQTISAGIPAIEGASGAFALLERAQAAAVAGLSTTEEAVNAIVSVVNAYGRTNVSAAEASDKLLKTVALGRTTFPQLASAIGRVAPVAAAYEVSLSDMLASLIQFTRAGLSTNEAVTGLRNLIKSLTQPTEESQRVLDALNKSSGKAAVEFTAAALRANGLQGQMRLLTEATGGATETIGMLFPNLRATLPALIAVGENAKEAAGFMDQLDASAGHVDGAVKKVAPTFDQVGKVFKSVLQSAFIEAGDRVIPLLIRRLKELGKWVEKNSEGFSTFYEGVIKLIDRVARLGAIMAGPLFKVAAWAAATAVIVTMGKGLAAIVGLAVSVQRAFAAMSVSAAAFATATGATAGRVMGTAMLGRLAVVFSSGIGAVLTGPWLVAIVASIALMGPAIADAFRDVFTDAAEVAAAAQEQLIDRSNEIIRQVKEGGYKTVKEMMSTRRGADLGTALELTPDAVQRINVEMQPAGDDPFSAFMAALVEGNVDLPELSLVDQESLRADALALAEIGEKIRALTEEVGSATLSPEARAEKSDLTASLAFHQRAIARKMEGTAAAAALRVASNAHASTKVQTIFTNEASRLISIQKFIKDETKALISEGLAHDAATIEARMTAMTALKDHIKEAHNDILASQMKLDEELAKEGDLKARANRLAGEVNEATLARSGVRLEEIKTAKKEYELQRKVVAETRAKLEDEYKVRKRNLVATLKEVAAETDGMELQRLKASLIEKQRKDAEKARRIEAARRVFQNNAERYMRLMERIQAEVNALLSKELKIREAGLKFELRANKALQKKADTYKDLDALLTARGALFDRLAQQQQDAADAERERDDAAAKASFDQRKRKLEETGVRSGKVGDKGAKLIAKDVAKAKEAMNQTLHLNETRREQTRANIEFDHQANLISVDKAREEGVERISKRLAAGAARWHDMFNPQDIWVEALAFVDSMVAFAEQLAALEQKRAQKFIQYNELRKRAAKEIAAIYDISDNAAAVKLLDVADRVASGSEVLKDHFVTAAVAAARMKTASLQAASGIAGAFGALISGGDEAAKRIKQASTDLDAIKDIWDKKAVGPDIEGIHPFDRALGGLDAPSLGKLTWDELEELQKRGVEGGDLQARTSLKVIAADMAEIAADTLRGVGAGLATSIAGVINSATRAATAGLEGAGVALASAAGLVSLDFNKFGDDLSSKLVEGGNALTSSISLSFTTIIDSAQGSIAEALDKAAVVVSERVDPGGNEARSALLTQSLKDGGELIAAGISTSLSLGAKTLTMAFEGFVSLLARTLDATLKPIVSTIQAPVDMVFGGLGEALGVLTQTRKDAAQERKDRQERLALLRDEFEVLLTAAEAQGASNEEIARLQSRFERDKAALLTEESPERTLANVFTDALAMVGEIVNKLPEIVSTFLVLLVGAIPIIIPKLMKVFGETITVLASRLGDILSSTINAIADGLPALVNGLAEALPDIVSGIMEGLITLMERLPEIVSTIVDGMAKALPRMIDRLIAAVPELVTKFAAAIPEIVGAIIGGIIEMWPQIMLLWPRIVVAIISSLPEIIAAFISSIPEMVDKIIQSFKNSGNELMKSILKPLGDFFKRLVDKPGETFKKGGELGQRLVGDNILGEILDHPVTRVLMAIPTLGLSEGARFLSGLNQGGVITNAMRNASAANMFRNMGAQGYVAGGMVDAFNSRMRASALDTVPALLQPGEGVLNRAAVGRMGGPQAVNAMNAGGATGDVNVSVGIVPNPTGLQAAAAALLPLLVSGIVTQINQGTGAMTTAMDRQSTQLLGFQGVPGRG